jgi:peptide/nickel transport system permease protein
LTESTEHLVDAAASADAASRKATLWETLIRNSSVVFGAAVLGIMVLIAVCAPLLGTMDPSDIDPAWRNKKPGTERMITADDGAQSTWVYRMGTDTLGRDTYSSPSVSSSRRCRWPSVW